MKHRQPVVVTLLVVLLASSGLQAQEEKPVSKRTEYDRTHPPALKEGLIRITGEVSRGQEFRKQIDSALDFVLKPAEDGWSIAIYPRAGDCNQDFVAVVTSPYRAYNPRYIFASYDMTTRDAVEYSPRDVSFVLNCTDYKIEDDRLKCVLWSCGDKSKETDSLAKLGTSPLGRAQLWITDSRSTRPDNRIDDNVGYIDWMRFTVDIELPRSGAGRSRK